MYRTTLASQLGLFLVASVSLAQDSTWDVIQHNILNENCASCHQAGTSEARQSGLLLTPDNAYDELVGAAPYNDAARNDGLLRVSTLGSEIGLSQSFLWEKINAPNQEHFYEDHPDYGAIMPLGDLSLTNGQLEFIEQWILQGAPATGSFADLGLLDDTSRFEPGAFEPPHVPDEGIQLHVGPFDVWPAEKHDREFFYFNPMVTEESTYVRGYEIKYREGSHHFILYHYDENSQTPEPDVYRDIRDVDGTTRPGQFSRNHAEWIVAAQSPHTEFEFPKGVALRLPPGSGFDFNVHSVNRTDEPRPGEVYVNFETTDADDVLHLAEQDSFSPPNSVLRLPPQQVTTITHTATFANTRNVVQMWTHAHERMVEFRVEHASGDRDGELIYWTNDWEHPPLLEEPMVFHRGDKVRLIATYNNNTDQEIGYGPLSTDEMMFMFYISHPNTSDVNGDDVVDVNDIDRISVHVRRASRNLRYDLNFNGVVDQADRLKWVERHMNTYIGDANLDGEFNSDDLVEVFVSGTYDTGEPAGWGQGDFDGDEDFDSDDLIEALEGGGYNVGRRDEIAAVPEPTSLTLAVMSGVALLGFMRRS